MARIRTLKPEICEDSITAGLSDAAFRLFVSAIVLADDHGNLQGDERWLRSQIWWHREHPPRVAEILRELRRASLVSIYEVRGQRYLHIRSWSKHQRIDNAGKPRVPKPDDTHAIEVKDESDTDVPIRGDSRRNPASGGEIPLDPDPERDPDPDPEHCASRDAPAVKPRSTKGSKPESQAGHSRVIEHWTNRYRAVNDGASPTWGKGKNTKLVSDLRAMHNDDEIIRRMDILFDGKGPAWPLAKGCDFGLFFSQFDKLASEHSQTSKSGFRNQSANLLDWQMQRVREAEEAEERGEEPPP